MNEPVLVNPRRDQRYLVPSGSPLLMPRIIRENLSWRRKSIRHTKFRNQCRSLAKIDWRHFDDPFREAAARLFATLESRGDLFFEFGPETLRVETFVRMVEYREHWVRDPAGWRPSPEHSPADQVFSLIDHLFATYPLPAFFRKAWMQPGPLRSLARDWFCQIAGGENVRALKDLPTKLSARAAHHTMAAPARLTIEQALRYGQVIAFGGSEQLAGEIVRSRIGENFDGDATWLKVIEKLAREPSFAPCEAPIVIDYLYYRTMEQDGRAPTGFLENNHIIEIARRARKFWRQTSEDAAVAHYDRSLTEFGSQCVRNHLLRLLTQRWEPSDKIRPATVIGQDGTGWRVSELCSELELQREGSRMHHCVAGYSRSCQRGLYSIWTVTDPEETHVATIRIYPSDMELDEARAAFNHQPSRAVLAVIRTWARANQIDDAWLTDTFDYDERPELELVC